MKKTIMEAAFVVVVFITLINVAPSCTHDTLNITQFDTVCFEREILPVFRNGCAIKGCHSGGGEAMDLTSYVEIVRGISPGSPAQSRLYQAITSSLIQPMPPSHPLAESDRIRIRIWIEQGAKNTLCPPEPQISLAKAGGLK